MRREMERFFDSMGSLTGFDQAGVFPAINLSEDQDSLFVRAELPGLAKEDFGITVENNTLTIAGERKRPGETDEKASYHRREREWGTFRRSFTLNSQVDSEKVEARYKDGILTVVLPKAAEAKPRQITVQAGA
jgi:HSP20 family protein